MEKNKTNQAVDIFDKSAALYQTKYMAVDKYHDSLNTFCSSLSNDDATILELTCGPGNITKYLFSQKPNLRIHATDLSPSMLQLAKENNPKASFQLLDCRSVLEMNSKYDAVICGFGLPYISKEEALKMIKDVSSSLNDGGIIYLSTMEDDYTKSGFKYSSSNPNEGLHLYFHEAEYLIQGMENHGFNVIEVTRVKYKDAENAEVTDLIIIGRLEKIK